MQGRISVPSTFQITVLYINDQHNHVETLDGGNSNNMCYFHPKTGEDEPMLTSIFFR